MKNKISFTSVLKSKTNKSIALTASDNSQHRQQKLIDIFQEFQINPVKPYTLELNGFRNMALKSRNSSIGLIKSNHTNEDPERNFDDWIEQKRENAQSIRSTNQKSGKGFIGFQQVQQVQQDTSQNRRSRSNFNKNPMYPSQHQEELQNSYQSNQVMENSKRYEQTQMDDSKKNYQRNASKPILHFQSQKSNEVQPERTPKMTHQHQEHQQIGPEEMLISEQLKPKSHFPSMEDQDYKMLQEEFERLKQEKIVELCMQTKKSVKKQKLEQIISKVLQNIYEDIEQMAENIIMKRKRETEMRKQPLIQDEVSEEMLISGCNDYVEQQQLNQSLENENHEGDEKRQEEMKNMIKGLISGYQEAKSQGKASTGFNSSKGFSKNESLNREGSHAELKAQSEEDSQEPSFNYQSNTFVNQGNYYSERPNESFGEKRVNGAKSSIPDSVGYSFANSNLVCEHSFNKDVMDHHQFSYPEENHFNKNRVNPPIYEPQNSDNEEEQRISLPNIEEVKSDCGDFLQNEQLESSEAIECKRNKIQHLTLDYTGNNIKNIESVHYEPPAETYGYQTYQPQSERNELFKNFEKPSYESKTEDSRNFATYTRKESNNTEKDEILKEQIIPAHQEQKFVSKTFSAYLSGEMRSEYGQAIKETPKSPNDSYSSKQSGFGYKIEPINRYSSTNKDTFEKQIIIPKPQSQGQSFQSISSPRNEYFVFTNNTNNSLAMEESKVKNNGVMNESSSQLSLNNSMNQPSGRIQTASSKNIHQLQSKTKFSINSPMTKIDDLMSNEEKMKRETNITQFGGFHQKTETVQFTKVPSGSYAVSSPIGGYKMNDSIPNPLTHGENFPRGHDYACAHSISSKIGGSLNDPFKEEQNSILSMQPLKMSNQNSIRVESVPSSQVKIIETSKVQISQKPFSSSGISDGKAFLQSLHEKQSIEISMSPEAKKEVPEEKASFVAETFRPTIISTQETVKHHVIPNDSHTITSNHKTSITKITLRSSDRNLPTSPKVISLSINPVPQKTETSSNVSIENKENVFEKLTIKESKNFESNSGVKINLASSINHQPLKTVQISNTQNFVDMSSKENSNTLNSLNAQNESKYDFSKPSVPSVTQKREPLLKSSRQFSNPPMIPNVSVKKSIGQGFKISSMASSKGISMISGAKQSIKNVQQSIGNDSDMDFDIELD